MGLVRELSTSSIRWEYSRGILGQIASVRGHTGTKRILVRSSIAQGQSRVKIIETGFPDDSWGARGATRGHYPEGARGTVLFDFFEKKFKNEKLQKLGSGGVL